jgi:hypothetical protein
MAALALVTEQGVCEIADNCKGLQLLNLNGLAHVTENGLNTLAYYLPYVKVATTFFGLSPVTNDLLGMRLGMHTTFLEKSAAMLIQTRVRSIQARQFYLRKYKI